MRKKSRFIIICSILLIFAVGCSRSTEKQETAAVEEASSSDIAMPALSEEEIQSLKNKGALEITEYNDDGTVTVDGGEVLYPLDTDASSGPDAPVLTDDYGTNYYVIYQNMEDHPITLVGTISVLQESKK